MSDDKKTDLEQRIVECQQKIEELSLSQDDPNSERIIRALQEQIALDSDRVSLLNRSSSSPELAIDRASNLDGLVSRMAKTPQH